MKLSIFPVNEEVDGYVDVSLVPQPDASSKPLVATFEFIGAAVPEPLFAVHVRANNFDAEGNGPSILATAKWIDAEPPVISVFDFGAARQQNYAAQGASIIGHMVRVELDASKFEDLGEGWTWDAVVTIDGKDAYRPKEAGFPMVEATVR